MKAFQTTPTETYASLVADNVHYLEQGARLLEAIDDALYAAHPPIAMSPVGGHLRHCIDFYLSFLDGAGGNEIDYDARKRDPRLETDRRYALDAVRSLMARLRAFPADATDHPLRVAMDRGEGEQGEAAWAGSTIRRELQFLRSHTVHHYALIAAVLQLLDFAPPADFGVAPATLAYRRRRSEEKS